MTPDDTILFCPDMFGFNYRLVARQREHRHGAFTRITNPMRRRLSAGGSDAIKCRRRVPFQYQRCRGCRCKKGPRIPCATNTGLLRLSQTTTTFEGHDPAPTWRVYVRPTSKKALDFEACEASQQKYITTWTAFPDDIDDGRWHHYAITVEKINVSGLTKTEHRLYRDYVSYGSQQFTGIIKYPDDDACAFTISADNNITGYID